VPAVSEALHASCIVLCRPFTNFCWVDDVKNLAISEFIALKLHVGPAVDLANDGVAAVGICCCCSPQDATSAPKARAVKILSDRFMKIRLRSVVHHCNSVTCRKFHTGPPHAESVTYLTGDDGV